MASDTIVRNGFCKVTMPSAMTRLLVVDRSDLLTWMVRKLAPPEVEVVHASDFSEAERALLEDPPDAALFHLAPCHPRWRSLIDHCVGNGRLIPFVCTGESDHFEVCNCTLPCRMEDFIPRDASIRNLADRLNQLIEESRVEAPARFQKGRVRWADEHPAETLLPTRNG